MMLIVHGLPKSTKFFELKALLTQECNISDFILDTFVAEEEGTKRVKVGLATEDQGDTVYRILDGYNFNGHILSVRGIGKDFHKAAKNTAEFVSREVYDNSHAQQDPAYSVQNVPQYSPMEVQKSQTRSFQERDVHVWHSNQGYSQNNLNTQQSGNPNINIPTHGHGQFSGAGYPHDPMSQNVQPAYQPIQHTNQWSAPNNQLRNMEPAPPINNPNYQFTAGHAHALPTPDNFDIPTRGYSNPPLRPIQPMRHEPVLRDIKPASPDTGRRDWDENRSGHTGRPQERGEPPNTEYYRRGHSPSRDDFRRREASPRNRSDMRQPSPQRKDDVPSRYSPTQDFLRKNVEKAVIQNHSMDKPFRRPAYEPTVSNKRPYGHQGKEEWKDFLQKHSLYESKPEETRCPPDSWNQEASEPRGKTSSELSTDKWKQKTLQDRHEKASWSQKPHESWPQKKKSPPIQDWKETSLIRSNKNSRSAETPHDEFYEHSSKNIPRNLRSNEVSVKDSWNESKSRDRQRNLSWERRLSEKTSNDAWKQGRNENDRHSFDSGRESTKYSKQIHESRHSARSRSPKDERSPKRSWAQERIRHSSPGVEKTAPPPPSWPGHNEKEHYSRPRPKSPVWEVRNSDELKRKLDHFDILDKSGSRDYDRADWRPRDGDRYSPTMAAHDESREAYRDSKLPPREEFMRRSEHFEHSDKRQRRDESDRHGYGTPDTREKEVVKRKHSPRHEVEVPRSLVRYHKEIRLNAIQNIKERILQRKCVKINDTETRRLGLELRLAISVILKDIITDRETTLNSILDKYHSKFNEKDEDELFREVLTSFSQEFITKTLKLAEKSGSAKDTKRDKIDSKNSADVDHLELKKIEQNNAAPSRWDISGSLKTPLQLQVPVVNLLQATNKAAIGQLMPMTPTSQNVIPSIAPIRFTVPMQQQNMMVMRPVGIPSVFSNPVAMINASQLTNTFLPVPPQLQLGAQQVNNDNERKSNSSEYDLCICKLDFSQFEEKEANDLRRFLVAEIFKASVNKGRSWAPTITMKGLQTRCRFELVAGNEVSRKWLINFDFSTFPLFDIALYTKEELWFERAAIWLPGFSKVKHLEPLAKLKLQNRDLDGVTMDKWKVVKKVITNKGTRIYVDIPPSSRQALEKHKMLLSYELVKVTVYMKSTTVDPDAFNAGLGQPSIDINAHKNLIDEEPMPVLSDNMKLVKIGYRNKKMITIAEAKQIKDKLVKHIFKFHQKGGFGNIKTDFIRYGFCHPGHFVVEPENKETENWLMDQKFGVINNVDIIAFGGESVCDKFLRYYADIPSAYTLALDASKSQKILQLLHKSNLKINKLNVRKWKIVKFVNSRRIKDNHLVLDIDKESADTLSKLKCKNTLSFDHVDRVYIIKFTPSGMNDMIVDEPQSNKDSYDVTNMDIASDDSN